MKVARHDKIIELIQQYDIDTQEELVLKLNAEGFRVTQATVSRDIRALNLTKVTGKEGKAHYAVLSDKAGKNADRFTRVLVDGILTMDVGQNILVVKTAIGMAMGVATAMDELKWPEILGCIAGDDTIMCVTKTMEQALNVKEKLQRIIRQ
ncbi:MAG: arginine repressor [Eubacteriales bacterium]|nr:arginine repressor [Eubacteriales bacterium]